MPQLRVLVLLSALLMLVVLPVAAQPQPAKPKLTAAEQAAIKGCLKLIRDCQLPDGAFRMKADGDPVWVRPYFGNHAALALLIAHESFEKNRGDLKQVEAWLKWYCSFRDSLSLKPQG